jgi:hypothetical protein
MDNEALRASGPEAYRAYVEDAASPVGNEGRRKKRPALCGEALLRKGGRYRPFEAKLKTYNTTTRQTLRF